MYDKKSLNYFSNVRKDIINFLPEKIDRVLEVGCGTGETLSFIKSQYKNATTVGIELTEGAAALAVHKVDFIKNIDVEKTNYTTGLGEFDLILLLDVLEHLRDPWEVLKSLVKNNLSINGTVITSIPNARNHALLFNLFAGSFDYKNSGVLDKTHLRFFTKNGMFRMMEDAGLTIIKHKPTNLDGKSRSSLLNTLTLGLAEEFLAVQYIIKSTKNK
jgi:2-polyprenyl-3-methyl-5-hydroxy-6-metoxy-1,4-benzoquinol methylase